MILQELASLYDRLSQQADLSDEIPSPGWSTEKVDWAVVLNAQGDVAGVLQLGIKGEKDKLLPLEMIVPQHLGRTGTTPKPYFLCDKTSYLLGVGSTDGGAGHERARKLHHEVLDDCEDAAARAVLRFFDREDPFSAISDEQTDALASGGMVVFCFERPGNYIHDREAIRDAWTSYLTNSPSDEPEGWCSVTRQRGPIARLFPTLTGIPGTKAPVALVSCNFQASESYGKEQAYNASISKDVTFKVWTVLKFLLGNRDRRIELGNTTIVTFWSDRPAPPENALVALMLNGRGPAEDDATNELIQRAFEEMRKGLPLSNLDGNVGFSILGVSPNKGRLSVRFYERQSLGRLAENYGDYLRDTAMVGVDRYSIWDFLLQTACLGKPENIPSTLVSRSFEAILRGTDFPLSFEQIILSRMRADHGFIKKKKLKEDVADQRAAILKACLVRRARRRGVELSREENFDMALNKENGNIGYLLGRLFAVMERAQQGALGNDINATIRDRYIGAASSTPARVFQPLLRNCQNHMSKLRKEKQGLANRLEKELDEIVGNRLGDGGLPKTLDMDDQGAFFIGYYQERYDLWHGKGSNDEKGSGVESENGSKED